jgi:hypothetical protein
VTDTGLKQLEKLPKLERLELRGTQVTAAGEKEIKRALPKHEICWIYQSPEQQYPRLHWQPPSLMTGFTPPVMTDFKSIEQPKEPRWPGWLGWLCPVLVLGAAAAARSRSGNRNN